MSSTAINANADRTVIGTFMTNHQTLGFRARCACEWVGEWRGYNLSAVESDMADHRCEEGA